MNWIMYIIYRFVLWCKCNVKRSNCNLNELIFWIFIDSKIFSHLLFWFLNAIMIMKENNYRNIFSNIFEFILFVRFFQGWFIYLCNIYIWKNREWIFHASLETMKPIERKIMCCLTFWSSQLCADNIVEYASEKIIIIWYAIKW